MNPLLEHLTVAALAGVASRHNGTAEDRAREAVAIAKATLVELAKARDVDEEEEEAAAAPKLPKPKGR